MRGQEALRLAFEAPDNRGMAEALLTIYSKAWGIAPGLDFVMPPGYASAHASYDPETDTIHLNPELPDGGRVGFAYYFLHELRHAYQYKKPERFPKELARGIAYAVLYDGTCHKRMDGGWRSCKLEGPEAYFTEIYLAQPHERDAGDFAYESLKSLVKGGEAAELEALRRFWRPPFALIKEEDMPREIARVYKRIDEATA